MWLHQHWVIIGNTNTNRNKKSLCLQGALLMGGRNTEKRTEQGWEEGQGWRYPGSEASLGTEWRMTSLTSSKWTFSEEVTKERKGLAWQMDMAGWRGLSSNLCNYIDWRQRPQKRKIDLGSPTREQCIQSSPFKWTHHQMAAKLKLISMVLKNWMKHSPPFCWHVKDTVERALVQSENRASDAHCLCDFEPRASVSSSINKGFGEDDLWVPFQFSIYGPYVVGLLTCFSAVVN